MNRIYKNLWLTETEKPVGCGYHFCITAGAISLTAYRTINGFNAYLTRTGLKPELIREGKTKETGWFKNYRLVGKYAERGFWKLSEIPKDAKVFKGLSNGSYVDCYHATVDGTPTIYLPNPNAKNVYKPVPLNEHIKIARED